MIKRQTAGQQLRRLQAEQAFDSRTWRERQLGRAVPFYGYALFQLGCPPLASFVAAFLGCLVTLHLSAAGLSPLIASAAAALLLCSSLILTRAVDLVPSTFFSSAYGGSFVGMTPVALLNASIIRSGLPLDAAFVLLSLFCGLMFCLGCAIDMWLRGGLARGYGGRLGALAAVASFLFVGLAPVFGTDGELFPIARRGVLDRGLLTAAITFVLSTVGMLATMAALRWAPVAGSRRAVRIFVAATVAFAGLVTLQRLAPSDDFYLDAYYAGCFVGMSSERRLRNLLQAMAAAVVLTALLLLTCPVLPAVGGSLGYVAFVSVLFVDAAVRLFLEAGEALRQSMVAGMRGLVAALAILVALLSTELLLERGHDDKPTGTIQDANNLPPAPAIPRIPLPETGADPSSGPAAFEGVPDLPLEILRPEDAARGAARRLGEIGSGAPLPAAPEPPRRVIRYGQTGTVQPAPAKRNQVRVVPQSSPRQRLIARHDAPPAQEWRPFPATAVGP
ncbi:hypothetical protein ACQR1I_34580 [Bradyrhizobium sp. HKCCYLS2038]|uniref:hypothetical protein n=1 Tax=unclassified Bradyrhizobium TaxID=2631580 RepID=UPI003EBA2FE2